MDVWISILNTVPGMLISLGVLLGVMVFLVPILLETPKNTQATDRRIRITDWSFSIAATLIGLGLLWVQLENPALGGRYGHYRFVIPGFFFAFAGFKRFGGARHWSFY